MLLYTTSIETLLGAAKLVARQSKLVEMERNGSDSSDDGRGDGSARTPQGGNRRRQASPDGANAPALNSNQNLSREERKIQASFVSFFTFPALELAHQTHIVIVTVCPLFPQTHIVL